MSTHASGLVDPLLGTIFCISASANALQAQTISLDAVVRVEARECEGRNCDLQGSKTSLWVFYAAKPGSGDEGRLVILPKTEFQDGVIEVDLAGEPGPGAAEGARGFVGVAFRVAADQSRF